MRFLSAAPILRFGDYMAGYALAFKIDFNDSARETDFDLLLEKLVGHAVEAVIHGDMIVEVHTRLAPEPDLVRVIWQRLQSGQIELGEQVCTRVVSPLHSTVVERFEQRLKRLIDLSEGEELLVSKGCKHTF